LYFLLNYEGFGFPVIKGLSYGRTVLARQTSLLQELASTYRGPGRLLAFQTPIEMEKAGRVLHDESEPGLPLGSVIPSGGAALNWSDLGRRLLNFIEQDVANPGASRWFCRERPLSRFWRTGPEQT
jgi:hypothetical protein